MVNIGLGLCVALVMYLLKMPNPLLWGALAAFAEFIPYLGATAMIALLTLAGLVTFEQVGQALLVPGGYLAVNLLQSQLISPLILGRRLTLNPVAIFVGLVFWWWIWGVPGAFIAVPLIATFKIFCDHIEALAPIGEFLGR
jgi:predicted PurR-regulated permease PerM